MTRTVSSTLVGLALLSGTACFEPPEEDAGDAAFATYAVTAVLGRRPHSVQEVYALQTLEEELGREAMLRVLMEQSEFVDYWSDVLMDDLLLWRSGGERPGDTSCYTEAHLEPYDHDELVEHLGTYTWATPFCPSDDGPDITSRSSSSSHSSPSGLLADSIEPRTAEQVERDEQVERYVVAGDLDALQALLDEEAREGGRRVTPSLQPVTQPAIEGFDAGDSGEVGDAVPTTSSVTWGAAECDRRFTMRDVLDASLSQDRLDVLYRVSLVTQATFTVQSRAERATGYFTSSFLNRDLACVSCHSSHYSTTSPTPRNGHWDRFEPAHRLALETNVFSYEDDEGLWRDGSLGGEEARLALQPTYAASQWSSDGGLQPFGMDPSCTVHNTGDDRRDGFVHPDTRGPTSGSVAGYQGVGVLELTDMFQNGVNELNWYATEPIPSGDYGPSLGEAAMDVCTDCHDGDGAPTFETNAYTMPPARLHEILAEGPPTGGMPDGYASLAGPYTTALTELDSYRPVSQYRLPETAMAHLTAMAIVDNVFEEVSGRRLTTETGFPRNEAASSTLEHLTKVFVDEGWSLRALLVEILSSTHVNRVAPETSDMEGYPLPMVVDPFADVNEAEVDVGLGDDANGQGDLVHRWSPRSLFRQVQHALDWPEAPLFPGGGGYLHRDAQRDIGARLTRRDLGFWEHDLRASLAWELHVGTCENPGNEPDFIDDLVASDLTVEEAMLAVKERLVTAPEWWIPEPGTKAYLLGGHELDLAEQLTLKGLDQPASSDAAAVRDFCAALLMSPQFLLAGLPAEVPDTTSWIPCERGAVCSHDDYCEMYASTAAQLGYGDADCQPYASTVTYGR